MEIVNSSMEYDKQYRTSLDKPPGKDEGESKALKWTGIILAVIGFLFLFGKLIPFARLLSLWPLALILVGGYLIWRSGGRS